MTIAVHPSNRTNAKFKAKIAKICEFPIQKARQHEAWLPFSFWSSPKLQYNVNSNWFSRHTNIQSQPSQNVLKVTMLTVRPRKTRQIWGIWKLRPAYSRETPNLGQNRWCFVPCDLEIWWMTLENNRAPLLSNIKLYASFHHHMSIQTGVTVRKRLSWVVTSVTLTFDLWPWPFAWTLLLSLVITPENLMMIWWWEHSQKGVTDRQTDRRTDGQTGRRTDRRKIPFVELLGRS